MKTGQDEARYEHSGIVLGALLTLINDEQADGPGADVAKPALAKALKSKFGWKLTSKRIVPKPEPTEPPPELAPIAEAEFPAEE